MRILTFSSIGADAPFPIPSYLTPLGSLEVKSGEIEKLFKNQSGGGSYEHMTFSKNSSWPIRTGTIQDQPDKVIYTVSASSRDKAPPPPLVAAVVAKFLPQSKKKPIVFKAGMPSAYSDL